MTDNLPPLPYAWHTEDHLTDKSATTYSKDMAYRWECKGWPVVPMFTDEQMQAYARAALAQAQSCVPAEPPFGSKRNAALALYRPPFKFLHGYIYDADGKMCADEGSMPEHVAARVRGWGRIGYMPDAEALQDEVGKMIAEALSAFWLAASTQPQPVQPSEQPRLTVRLTAFPESNGKRNWTALLVRVDPWGGLIGNCGGIQVGRGELWNRVAYEAECARFLIGERDTEPYILDYGDDIETPEQWAGETHGGRPARKISQAKPEQAAQPHKASDVQWQKRHPNRDGGAWVNTNEHDAKWWKANGTADWEIRVLYAMPVDQEHPLEAPKADHEGMTVAGNGAQELGALMREQWANRGGVYPDGNPNAGGKA